MTCPDLAVSMRFTSKASGGAQCHRSCPCALLAGSLYCRFASTNQKNIFHLALSDGTVQVAFSCRQVR